MRIAKDVLEAMIEGMKRVKRVPQKEWLDPIIQRLSHLQEGDHLTFEILDLKNSRVTDDAREFGNSRETSPEIAQQIFKFANDDLVVADRIWADPTDDEERRIIRAAFTMTDEPELMWCGDKLRRRKG